MKAARILATFSMLALGGAFASATNAAAQEGRAAYIDDEGVCRLCVPGYNCPCAILPPVIIT